MRYVVVYDVSDDRLRQRVANTCEAFGFRVQESVFECELTPRGLEELVGGGAGGFGGPGRKSQCAAL